MILLTVIAVLIFYGSIFCKEIEINLDTITVTGEKSDNSKIKVEREEQKFGLQEDLNEILFLRPGMNRIPEAGSKIFANGSSPFDISFFIFNVPVFSPSHFSGHRFIDKSSMVIPSLKTVMVNTQTVAGNYTDAAGMAVNMEPGLSPFHRLGKKRRPEITADFGMFHARASLQLPIGNETDGIGISASNTDDEGIRLAARDEVISAPDSAGIAPFLNRLDPNNPYLVSTNQDVLSYGIPKSFNDFHINGQKTFKHFAVKTYGLLAVDQFNKFGLEDNKTEVWGVGAVDIADAESRWKMQAGGSRQSDYKSYRAGPDIMLKKVNVANASALLKIKHDNPFKVDMSSTFTVRGRSWNGSMDIYRADSLEQFTTNTTVRNNMDEVQLTVQEHLRRCNGIVHYGVDVLSGYMRNADGSDYSLFMDPGMWLKLSGNRNQLLVAGGIQTGWPDIRGIPSVGYRFLPHKTFMLSSTLTSSMLKHCIIMTDVYLHYRDREPRAADYINPLWEQRKATGLLSYGTNLQCDVTFSKTVSWVNYLNLGKAVRHSGSSYSMYEWNVPWAVKSILKLSWMKQIVNLYVKGIFSQGLPYWNITDRGAGYSLAHLPWYKRVDLRLQINQPVVKNRFLTQLTGYCTLVNFFNFFEGRFKQVPSYIWENTREVYYDSEWKQQAIILQPFCVVFGLRVGCRL